MTDVFTVSQWKALTAEKKLETKMAVVISGTGFFHSARTHKPKQKT